jgi:hypothetical protein
MIIQDVLAALKDAPGPIVKILVKGNGGKVIVLGFRKGMVLKEHKTGLSTRLMVIDGQINYFSSNGMLTLSKFDELDIPVNEPHSVEALADSICFLIQV